MLKVKYYIPNKINTNMKQTVNTQLSRFIYNGLNLKPEQIESIVLLENNNQGSTRFFKLKSGKNFHLSIANIKQEDKTVPVFGIKENQDSNWFTFEHEVEKTKSFLDYINEAEPAVQTEEKPEVNKETEQLINNQKYDSYLNGEVLPYISKELESKQEDLNIFIEGVNQNIIEFFSKTLGLKAKRDNLTLPKGVEEFKDKIENPILFTYGQDDNMIKFIAFSKFNFLDATQNQSKKVVIISNNDFNKLLQLDTSILGIK